MLVLPFQVHWLSLSEYALHVTACRRLLRGLWNEIAILHNEKHIQQCYLFTKVLIYIEASFGRCFGSYPSKRCLQQSTLVDAFSLAREKYRSLRAEATGDRAVRHLVIKALPAVLLLHPFSYRLDTVHSALLR